MTTQYAGIDYGLGQTNIDHETGIRYGVISQNEVLQAWADDSEADYGSPSCPKCGNEACEIDDPRVPDFDDSEDSEGWEVEGNDHACPRCKYAFDSQDAYGDEPLGFTFDGDGIVAQSGSDGDIFILKSPFYTRAQFCSPCAPGAAYLMNPVSDGPRAYCFDHSWFDDGKAPYPVYRVDNDEEVTGND